MVALRLVDEALGEHAIQHNAPAQIDRFLHLGLSGLRGSRLAGAWGRPASMAASPRVMRLTSLLKKVLAAAWAP